MGVLNALATLLRSAGHEVFEAERCEDALETVPLPESRYPPHRREHAGDDRGPDDQEAAQEHPTIGIIAMSGGGMHQNPELATTLASIAGADRALEKPFKNEILLSSVHSLLSTARRPPTGRR